MPPFFDAHNLPEDTRIELIGQTVMKLGAGRTTGVCVDDEPGKPERYVKKLTEKFPAVKVLSQSPGPVPGVVTIILTRGDHGPYN